VSTPQKVAIIGTGFGKTVHYPAFSLHNEFDPVIMVGRNQDKTNLISKQLEIEGSIDWEEVISREDIDVISISTDPAMHYSIAKKAIQNHKHVICEKPVGLSYKQVNELWRLSQEFGVTCMVNIEFRYIPERAFLVELINNGYIGEVYNFNISIRNQSRLNPRLSSYNWYSEKSQGGGVLNALGSLYIDMILQIFSKINVIYGKTMINVPKRLDKTTGKMREVTADDSFISVFESKNVSGTISVSSVAPFGNGTRIEFYGSNGYLSILEDLKIRGAKIGQDEKPKILELPGHLQLPSVPDKTHFLVKPFLKLLNDFSVGLSNGSSLSPNFKDAANLHKIIDSINRFSVLKK
jgi:predicted dehydrogenase